MQATSGFVDDVVAYGGTSIPLQRVTSLRRCVQANAPAASYWLRRVLWRLDESIVRGVTGAEPAVRRYAVLSAAVPTTKPEATAIGGPQDGRWKITLTLICSMRITVRNQWTQVSHTAI